MVLLAGPGTSSTVAGSKGTAVFTEPRVAMVAQLEMTRLVTTLYSPVDALNELVNEDPRLGMPEVFTTAMFVFAFELQTTAT